MAFDYSELATVAQELLRDFGKPVTLTKKNRSAADAAKPWRGPSAADTTANVYAVVVPNDRADEKQGLTRRGAATGFVAALDAPSSNIEEFDTLNDGSKVWKIEAVRIYNPGTTRLVYKLTLTE